MQKICESEMFHTLETFKIMGDFTLDSSVANLAKLMSQGQSLTNSERMSNYSSYVLSPGLRERTQLLSAQSSSQ